MTVKRWLGSDAVDILIRIIIAITLLISVITYIREYKVSTCQANYNQAYAQYAAAARDSKNADDAVMRELLISIRNARKAPNIALAQKAVDDAFNKYFTTVDNNDKYRLAHPPPPLPDQYCG